MSQELERVYTINLGKVLLSPNNQRAKRAINMVKEFARHHMKTEQIKLEEDLSHQIWHRGIRHPPRKIRVKMTKTDEGFVLVSPYEEEIETEVKPKEEKKTPAEEVKAEPEVKEEPKELIEEVKEKKPKTKETPKTKEPKGKEPKTKEKPKEAKQKPKEQKPKAKEQKTKKSKPKETKSKGKKEKKSK